MNIFPRGIITFLILSVLLGFLPANTLAAPDTVELTQLYLYANIETVGVVVNGVDLPQTAELLYRQSGQEDWHTGHPLMRIETGALVGSLFDLFPATTYEVKVRSGANELSASTVTQPLDLQFIPSKILHVNSTALQSGDGSATKPFHRIQDAVDQATPGTQILVADGIYKEEITFPNSGSAGNWIQLKAAGNSVILDGSRTVSGDVWSAEGRDNVWRKQAYDFFAYLARDGERFFQYDDLGTLRNDYGGEGWYLDPDTLKLYIRSRTDPSTHTWQVPFLNQALRIEGQDWIWIEGFDMRFYGTGLSAFGIYTRNASHIVIRNNNIHNIRYGIYIDWTRGNDGGNDTRIEYNEISDAPVNEWNWGSVKATSMEGTAIVLKGHIGAIVRGNDIHNFFNGIYTGSSADRHNPGLAFDIDVYDNYFHQISDDALEPEGACVNHRFRDNMIDDAFVGVSLAPVSIGPTWVLRSTFANYTGRGIKWDRGSSGLALIYHNTFWTTEKDIAAMDFIAPAKNGIVYNNIFQNTSYGVYEVQVGSTDHNWDHNNWYSPKRPRFEWEGNSYANLEKLCAAYGLGCHSIETDPELANPGGGNFALRSTSPDIDRGVSIPGINDNFSGAAPDIGAYEFGSISPPSPSVSFILRANPNPTNAETISFTLIFSEPVTGVHLSPPLDDLALVTSQNTSDASIIGVEAISETTYSVNVSTGSGSGDIRLDFLDNNSIFNLSGIPLGGNNIGDGNFDRGETYTIDKTPPSVSAISRSALDPTSAESVMFTISFTEDVSGLDTSDLTLTTSGEISNAGITDLSGSGSMYTVTAATGTGKGTLRLDLLDNDSIVDAVGNPLGGVGAGNGSFSGDTYTINKDRADTLSERLISLGKYDGWVLESSAESGIGGEKDAKSIDLFVGDDENNREYRSILHFSTKDLPNDIVIDNVMLMIKRSEISDETLFSTHGNILVDIQDGAFGYWGPFHYKWLQKKDFEGSACQYAGAVIQDNPMDEWYWAILDQAAIECINLSGITQFRLRFQMGNDQDATRDYISFYSGNDEDLVDRPYLIVVYHEE